MKFLLFSETVITSTQPDLQSKTYSVLLPKKLSPMKENPTKLIKSTISLKSTTVESNNPISPVSIVEEALRPTTILQPFESQSYKVKFFPDKIGQYREKFSLTIANSFNKTYIINVEGVSDIPRINTDPSIIFSKVN